MSKTRKRHSLGPKKSRYETDELSEDCKPSAGAIELNSNRIRAITDVSDSSRHGIIDRGYHEKFDLSNIYDFISEIAKPSKPLERDDGNVFIIFKNKVDCETVLPNLGGYAVINSRCLSVLPIELEIMTENEE